MTILSTKSLSALGYNLPDELAPVLAQVNQSNANDPALIADAQEAIDDYAATLDAELSASGHYARGMVSEQACKAAEANLRSALNSLSATVER